MYTAQTKLASFFYSLCFYVFLAFLYVWALLAFIKPYEVGLFYYDYYTYTYGVIALLGSIPGFYAAKVFGFPKSTLGKALFLFSVALLFQFFGQLTFAYYSFYLGIENPYPSVMEVFYFGSLPIYIAAAWYLAKASGYSVSVKTYKNNMFFALFLPVMMVVFAYYLFLRGYDYSDTTPLIVFLDFGYPILQAVQVSIAVVTYLVTKNLLGGILKKPVLLVLIALVLQYMADVVYTVRTFNETWEAGGISDLMYLVSYFAMGYALHSFIISYYKLKESNLGKTNVRN